MRKPKYRGNRCSLCGAVCVPAVDNYGQSYMGCPYCVIVAQVPKEADRG